MKFVIAFVALFAVAYAASTAGSDKDAQIVNFNSDVQANKFAYGYDTSNGIHGDAEGVLQAEGSDHESISVHGSYQFTADDGQQYTVNYVADENGFQPQGAHLPKN